MPIEITNAEAQPALNFNRLHLQKMEIEQKRAGLDADPSVFRVVLMLWRYAVDQNGIRHYHKEGPQPVLIEDYLAYASLLGDADKACLMNCFTHTQMAVAVIARIENGLQTGVV